jgi:hypothetical protein
VILTELVADSIPAAPERFGAQNETNIHRQAAGGVTGWR